MAKLEYDSKKDRLSITWSSKDKEEEYVKLIRFIASLSCCGKLEEIRDAVCNQGLALGNEEFQRSVSMLELFNSHLQVSLEEFKSKLSSLDQIMQSLEDIEQEGMDDGIHPEDAFNEL